MTHDLFESAFNTKGKNGIEILSSISNESEPISLFNQNTMIVWLTLNKAEKFTFTDALFALV